jgi:putative phage-type endonuclease
MKPGLIFISTKDMGYEDWLKERQKGIGGSDAAAIVGLTPWSTPYSVWADKTGKVQPKEDNESMRQGRDFEDYVAHRWMESTGKRCRRWNAIIRNPEYPFAHANVDRWLIGENAGLECKTTSTLSLKKFKNGEYPENYYCQCMHYMAVTGADRWYLAVLVLGREFMAFTMDRDEEEIDALMKAERDFWGYVEEDSPPPVDGFDPTTDAINTIYSDGSMDGDKADLFGMGVVIDAYQTTKGEISILKHQNEEREQLIKQAMKESQIGTTGRFRVEWKNRTRRSFDSKSFMKDNPDVEYGPYIKETKYRAFSIKEEKNG